MAKTGKNVHLEHLEDEIINKGAEGGNQAIKILREMGVFMTGSGTRSTVVTTKWDGAPAVICGTDPADGKFFVGTKAVFSKEPKVCKSHSDIDKHHSGGLAAKLHTSFEYLSELSIKGVLQGDLMFTDDKKNKVIDGQDHITFRANTITYAVESKSDLGKEISKAKIGIVFHTKYEGRNLSDMKSSFIINDNDFRKSPRVWVEKAEYNDIGGIAKFTPAERQQYDKQVNMAEGSIKKSSKILDQIQSGKKTLQIDTEFKKFFNSYVKEGRSIPSVDRAYNDFLIHMGKEYDKKIQPLKRLETQADKAYKFIEMLEFVDDNEAAFKMIIAAYMNIQRSKDLLIKKMKKVVSLKHFVDKGNGDYEVTSPEGFVAISKHGVVKLVDRLEFSKLNFIVPKTW